MFRSIIILICSMVSYVGYGQCNDGCKKKKDELRTVNYNAMSVNTFKSKGRSVVCKLTTPELQKRKETIIADLKANVLQKKELSNGFKYLFNSSDIILDQVTTFIKTERMCCGFFDFTYTVSENNLWLSITGPKGTKDFIKDEMDF